MKIGSIFENLENEKRISITPDIVKKYLSIGFKIFLSKNYGTHLGFNDDAYKNLGVNILDNDKEVVNNSDIIVQLGLPPEEKLTTLKENQILIGSLNAYLNKEKIKNLSKKKN